MKTTETFEQRLDEINYRTELLKVQTQFLLKDLLSKVPEDGLCNYEVNPYCYVYSHIPGTLEGEACDMHSENFWTIKFDEMSLQDQLYLIKYIIENKLHETVNATKI